MDSPRKAIGKLQASSPVLTLETPRQRVPESPHHGSAPSMSPGLPYSAELPGNSQPLMRVQPQHELSHTPRGPAAGPLHHDRRFSRTQHSLQTSSQALRLEAGVECLPEWYLCVRPCLPRKCSGLLPVPSLLCSCSLLWQARPGPGCRRCTATLHAQQSMQCP